MKTQNIILLLIKIGLVLVIVLVLLFLQEKVKVPQQLTTLLGAVTIWAIWRYKPKRNDNENQTLN